jgi:Trk K+ transport system NAD-binding subunit
VIGDDGVGIGVAQRLGGTADPTFVGPNRRTVEAAESAGTDARRADLTDPWSLRRAGVDDADLAVVACDGDDRNVLVAQLLTATLGVDDVVVRLADPRNADAFDDVDVDTVCVSSMLAEEIAARLTT